MCLARRTVMICCVGLAFTGTASATIRYVNVSNAVPVSPYTSWGDAATNIQMAVTASVNDDEIRVGPGLYRISSPVTIPENKRLTLRSTQSRAAIIDAQRLCQGVNIFGTNSLIEGFSIRNGMSGSYGGGIVFFNTATVRDCLVVSNQAYGGGGIMIFPSTSLVERCTIEKNLATYVGGGVTFYNHATGVVNNCIIRDNIASNYAGGVYFQLSGTVSNSWIADNRTILDSGGGAYMDQGGRMVNTIVVGNQAATEGGGIYVNNGGYIAHCTVVSNRAVNSSGGIFGSAFTAWNSIVYYNLAPTAANVTSSSSVFSNCCVTPGLGGSNFTNAPMFNNLASRDFHLAVGSPCIEAGATNPAVAVDYDGTARPQMAILAGSPQYDVGAFEYQMGWDAGYQSIGSGWRRLTWFGDYIPMGADGWIWHNKHGFFYVPAGGIPQSVWMYAQDMGWLYTGSTLYPFLYRSSPVAWLWYNGSVSPRWFRNLTTGTWESRP